MHSFLFHNHNNNIETRTYADANINNQTFSTQNILDSEEESLQIEGALIGAYLDRSNPCYGMFSIECFYV